MPYSEEDRKEVIKQAQSFENQMKGMNMAFAYNMYDIMRLQLEELHRIGDTMESILQTIRSAQQNQ